MDPLNIQDNLDQWFNLTETKPYTPHFESFGIDNMNFFLNSGSIFALLSIIIVFFTIRRVTSGCAKICKNNKCMRKVGVWAYKDTGFLDFRKAITRLQLETYLDICFATLMGMQAIYQSENRKKEFFSDFSNIFCSVLTILFFVLQILFVIRHLTFIVIKRKEIMEGKVQNDESQEILDGLNTESFSQIIYSIIFVIRRLILVAILMYMKDYPFF